MDRPIIIGNLHNLAVPELGLQIVQASDPTNLAARVEARFAALAACGVSFPYIQGFTLGAGGGGASWRACFECVQNVGWGLLTAVSAASAHFHCGIARNASEVHSLSRVLLSRIQTACPGNAFIWKMLVAGSGRDGSFMVGILWSCGVPGRMTRAMGVDAASGALAAATPICFFTLERTLSTTINDHVYWQIAWSTAIRDIGGTGVKARLEVGGAVIAEYEQTNAVATDWMSMGGTRNVMQDSAAATLVELIAEPNGGNTCEVRASNLSAVMVNAPGAES